ncbi:MAG: ATP-binding protein [Chloroflexia bacterium]
MLSIHLFGQPHLLSDEQPVKLSSLPKILSLLSYLLLHRDHPIKRETLAFALWPDDSEANARANLRRHLHELRRTLPPAPRAGDWLLVEPSTIQWNPASDYWLDVAEFERLSASPDTLAEAFTLYGGDLLENVYDDWLFYDRERLRHLYFADLSRIIQQSRVRRDYSAAIEYAHQLLDRDPLREQSLRQLMSLRYEAGDRSGALEEYELFARRLRVELDVDPMPETTALYEVAVRNARLPSDTSGSVGDTSQDVENARSREQSSGMPFVGRSSEVEQLRGWWGRAARGAGGVVLIGGEAGIGKTRLTAETARQAEMEGARVLFGGTTFVEPVPYQAVVEALRSALPLLAGLEIDPIWLAAAGVLVPELQARRADAGRRLPVLSPLDPDRERTRLFEAIARCLEALAQPRPVLLILEDLHWAGAATIALLESLARRAPGHSLLIIATYRQEEAHRSHPLRDLRRRLQRSDQMSYLPLGRLPAQDVETLVEQVPAFGADAGEVARHLYTESEGNPFFLGELIRDLLESRKAEQGVEPQLVGSSAPGVNAPASGGVRAIIAARVARLSPQAKSLAEIAAVIGPAFDVELVREVSGWDEHQVLSALDELLDRQLVRETVGPGTQPRRTDYAFTHHLIQATIYADVPAANCRRRHRRAAQVIEEMYPHLLDELSGELAAHFDRGDEPGPAAQYYLRAARRTIEVHADEEALRYLSRGLELATESRLRFDLLALTEELHSLRSEYEARRLDLEMIDEIAGSLQDEELICEVLRRRILFKRALGERQHEAELIDALKKRADASGEARWRAEALQSEAAYQVSLGRYDAARTALEPVSALRQELGDVPGLVECYALMSEVAAYEGRFGETQDTLKRATAMAGAEANQSLLVRTLRAASIAAITQVQIDAAHALGEQMLALCRTIGDREGEADAHGRIAAASTRMFHVEEARAHYKQAELLYTALRNRRGQATVLVNSGMLAANLGRYAEAIEASRRAEKLFADLDDLRGRTVCLINIAQHALRQSDYLVAEAAGVQGLELAGSLKSPVLEAYALANLGAAERELGRLEQAVAHMEAGLEIRRSIRQDPVELATDLCDLTVAYLRAGDLAAAQQTADEMLGILSADPEHMTYPQFILWAAAQTYRALGQTKRANELLAQAYQVLQEKVASIPDAESRETFAHLSYNRELLAAYEAGDWPH